jgi:hypothetical protein
MPRGRLLPVVIAIINAAAFLVAFAPAAASPPAPTWTITSVATPTSFSSSDNAKCSEAGRCDSYTALVTNNRSAPTDGSTITIADTLPAGLTVQEVSGFEWQRQEPLECTTSPLQCTLTGPLNPDDTMQLTITVEVAGATGSVVNEASVTGGGAAAATSTVHTDIDSGPPLFAIQDLSFSPSAPDGTNEDLAGQHPYDFTTSFGLPSRISQQGESKYSPSEQPKDVAVYLPPGFLGDPQAAPRCPLTLLEASEFDGNPESSTFGQYIPECPSASRVGIVDIAGGAFARLYEGSLDRFTGVTSVFNLVPEGDHPAELGFRVGSNVIEMYPQVVRTSAGYQIRVGVPGLPEGLQILATTLTLFGQPGARDGEKASTAAFISNPSRCTNEPLMGKLEADSWEDPGRWVSGEAEVYPFVDGCEALVFEPAFRLQPESTAVDTPSGYEVDVRVPNSVPTWQVAQTPDIRDVTVTLPAGLSLSPSAADGLEACEASGPNGIDIPHGMPHPNEAGEGEAIGPDGLSYLTPGHCPSKSQVGEVEVETPLLEKPLHGHLYLAEPKCGGAGQPACTEASATNGELYGLYLEVEGSGVIIKLKGTVSANPTTGQLTTTFTENPQLPFDELKIHLTGGPRAPLANPQTCGSFTTTTDLSPWSAPVTPDATPSSSFEIGGCTGSPFGPGFTAGTITPTAGAFSPFTLTFSRRDGEQDLSGITVNTPPGLLGKISEVPLCREPQTGEGACPAASRIGTTNVAAGAGSHPFWLSGSVYLTSSYKGAPFGLSIVVPEKAGPFNLGNEVVRAAINIDPRTSALTVTSDPLPQHKDGVPFRLKTINTTIDRPNFMFNPTNCSQQAITATISGVLPDGTPGASVPVSSPFAAAGCKNLPFKPSFTVSTQARTSKANGASLDVKVAQKPGEANIHKVDVSLPLALPSRLTTLQKACSEAQFATNPAGCPAGSNVGTATAHTPVLNAPLTGPAYLVSHGGASFPDLDIVLQGEGITINLTGNTDIKKGITFSRFETVPDAPIDTFELNLPEGPHSALAAVRNLCEKTLVMPTTITGQNGAQVKQSTKIAVTGCRAVTISKRKLSGKNVALSFILTAKGSVTVTGKGLKNYRKTLGAGSHQIKIGLSRVGLSMRRHHRKIKIKVTLKSGPKVSGATTTLKL